MDSIEKIIERLRSGEPIRELAAENDMSWRELRDQVEDVLGSPAEDRDEIRERVRKGEKLDDIAKDYATSRQNIHRLVTDVGRRHDNRRGSRTRAAKLTGPKVLAMRRAYAAGETQKALCAKYDLSPGTVQRILRGGTWTHIEMPEYSNRTFNNRPVPIYQTPEGIARIKKMLDSGMSWGAIAGSFEIERGTLRRAVTSLAPELLNRPVPVYRTPEGHRMIEKMRGEGMSWAAIADHFGIGQSTLARVVKPAAEGAAS